MKKILNIILPVVLIFSLSACKKKNTDLSYRALSKEINAYYKNVNTSKSGDDFILSLTKTITKDYNSFSYSQCWNILAKADEDPYNSDNIVCAYSGVSINKKDHGVWNREHTWAQSHGINKKGDAYTDCHHLTATEAKINESRGNLDFGLVSDYSETFLSDNYGNKWIKDVVFEPRDEVKGDVARKLFYMVARYNDNEYLDLTLVNTKTTTSSDGKGSLGYLDTLLKWHYEDPVSKEEIDRNEVVYSYQNNRNPFIDHPEWVNKAFRSKYANYKVDSKKVKNVISAINSLSDSVTLEDENSINNALALMDELNYQEKLYVNNYPKLSLLNRDLLHLKSLS